MPNVTIDFNANLARWSGQIDKAMGDLDRFRDRADKLSTSMGSLVRTLGVGISVAGIAGLVKGVIDAQDEIAKMSQKTGLAVETLAGLQHAADLSAVGVDQLAKGVRTFSVLVDEAANGQKSYQDKLVSLGLNYRDLQNLSPEKQFYKLADAVSKLGAQDRATKVAAALGDRMSVLVPLLSGGADELRRMVEEGQRFNPVTAESAKQAEKFNDELDRLKKAAGTAGIKVSMELLPPMADWLVAVNKLIERYGVLVGVLAGIGAAVVPGLTADQVAGTEDQLDKFRKKIAGQKEELLSLENQLKSGAAGEGLLQRYFFGSTAEVQTHIKELREIIRLNEISLQQAEDRLKKASEEGANGATEAAKKAQCEASNGVWDGKSCRPKPTGGAKVDPLAGLINSTDVGRMREFDKTVALLNARFNNGTKDVELYTQAMSKLIEKTFAGNYKTKAYNDETERMVAEHLKATTDELRAQKQEWIDAGKAIEDQYMPASEKLGQRIDYLNELFARGLISHDALDAATADAFDSAGASIEKATDVMSVFAEQAARNIQDAFAEFLFDPFDQGLGGMLKSFGVTIQKMVAQAVAADLAKRVFGSLGGGTGSGWLGSIANFLKSEDGNVFMNAPALSAYSGSVVSKPTVFPFANGIGLMGEAGPEAILPLKRGPDGKLGVDAGGAKGGHTVNVYLYGVNNAPDVRNAGGKVARQVLGAIEGSRRYG